MTPSIEIRLTSLIHGLRDVIFPAINPAEALAVEQSGLILAQLNMLLQQLPYADRYYRLCRDDARSTAAVIVENCAGGPRSKSAAEALIDIMAQAVGEDPHDDYLKLASGIGALTTAVAADGDLIWRAQVNPAVIAFSVRQNWRERVWFKDAGFDPNPAELPDIAILCSSS